MRAALRLCGLRLGEVGRCALVRRETFIRFAWHMQASQKEVHYGFWRNSQVRGGAEFRALREYMGLSVEDFARVTCASVSKVVAWEGLSEHIPDKVWRLVDEAVDVFDNLVDDLADVEVA